MKAVVQRVDSASVDVGGERIAAIGRGLLVLAAVEADDDARDREWMAEKLVHLRVFTDGAGKMNLSVPEVGGEILLVPNFTVAGETGKGRRPGFDRAMKPPRAQSEFEALVASVRARGVAARTGAFGAHMYVSLVNDGPVTLIVDSRG